MNLKLFFIFVFLVSFAKAHPVIYKDGFVYWGEFSHQKNTQTVSYTFHPRFAFQLSSNFKKHDNNDGKSITYQAGLNALVKRWLLEGSQANIYTSLQGGVFTAYTGDNTEIQWWAGFLRDLGGKTDTDRTEKYPIRDKLGFQWNLSADWESRKVYTAGGIKLKGMFASMPGILFGDFHYRIGFAPYVAGMDTLQTWFVLMFQTSAFRMSGRTFDVKDFLLRTKKQEGFLHQQIWIGNDSAIGLNWKITPLLRFFYKNVLWEIGSSLQSDFYLTLMVHY